MGRKRIDPNTRARCAYDGCDRLLNRGNMTGFCRFHHHLSPTTKLKAHESYLRNRDRSIKKSAAWKLMFKYGITLEQKNEMLESQGSVCAICGISNPTNREGRGSGWRLDHCHDTGKVRGVLCHNCNIGLGHFRDDPEVMQRAIAYLSLHASPR